MLLLAVAGATVFAIGLRVGSGRSAPGAAAPHPARDAGAAHAATYDLPAGPEAVVGPIDPPATAGDRPVTVAVADIVAPGAGGGRIALVIDDLGRELEPVRRLTALGVPVSYSVLPFESRTGEVVAALHGEQLEILLHLPMQAQGDADPGPGALYTNLGADDLRRRTARALDAVPGAVGVNNHMGSAFTADPAKMRPVLAEIGRRGLFFLDSRTSGRSVGYELARELGIPAAQRTVFLDNLDDRDAVAVQFAEVLQRARRDGAAIAIGHPYESTLEVLSELVPKALDAGYEFVPVSFLLERTALSGE